MHGSAPDIAGKGVANPTALMLAAAMMLDHCRLHDPGRRACAARSMPPLNRRQIRTGDLGGRSTTAEFTRAIVARIGSGLIAAPPPMSEMQTVISIAASTSVYASGHSALRDMNLDIRKGEIFALLGPNGAGKTTLINIVCGIVTRDRGTGVRRRA